MFGLKYLFLKRYFDELPKKNTGQSNHHGYAVDY